MEIFCRHSIYRVILILVSVLIFWGGALQGQTLSVNPTALSGFTYIENAGPSDSQSYRLSGNGLTPVSGNITFTGSLNYEVSASNQLVDFGNTVTISYSGGVIDTVVFVHLKAGLIPGNYNGEFIVNTGGGASAVTVTCSGNVTCALVVAPIASVTIQPTCTQPTGTIIITSPTTGLTFSLDGTAYAAYPPGGYTLVPPGPHTLTAQNASNCVSAVTNVTVNPVPNGPTAIVINSANATCGLSNGSITLGAVTGGTAPYTYSVDASAFTASTSYLGLAAGLHSIQVRDANLCNFSTNVTITNVNGPTAIVVTPANATCGLSNGSITLGAVTGGTPPYTYSVDA
ncbi:MAG: hypothetical protein WC780_18815, partial [Lentimicrobiaceae bacterium]